MASGLTNIFRIPELRKRLLFSLGMLAVYRLGIFVTTPGVDRIAMRRVVSQGSLLGLLNFFSGGALEQLSIFALGIMPYVSASIILQLLTVVVPALEKLKKEGELGQRKITQYTRYGTVVLSAIQGYGISTYLETLRDSTGLSVLVKALKRVREADGRLDVVVTADRVAKVFRLTGLDQLIPLHPSVAEALAG